MTSNDVFSELPCHDISKVELTRDLILIRLKQILTLVQFLVGQPGSYAYYYQSQNFSYFWIKINDFNQYLICDCKQVDIWIWAKLSIRLDSHLLSRGVGGSCLIYVICQTVCHSWRDWWHYFETEECMSYLSEIKLKLLQTNQI